MGNFWTSWTADPRKPFTYEGPWWCSGYAYFYTSEGELECPTICAAVVARDEEHAKAIIVAAHDNGDGPSGEGGIHSWRFVTQKPDDWTPGGGRFERADWMKWPWPADTPIATGSGL